MSLSKRVTLNFGAVLLGKLAQTIYAYATVPLYLHYWGVERLGGWLVISVIPAWIAMSDLGFGSVTANEMVLRFARGDKAGARRSLHTALCVLGGLIAAALLILLAGAWAIDWHGLLGLHVGDRSELAAAVFLLGAGVLFGLPVELFRGMLRCEGRTVDASMWSSTKPGFDLAATWLALHAGASMAGLAGALMISQFSYTVAFMLLTSRRCREMKLGFRECDKSEVMLCLRKGGAFSLFPLSNALALQGSMLAINAALGAKAVLIFGTVRTLCRAGYQVVTLIYASVQPEMGRLIGAQDLPRARRLHRVAVAATLSSLAVAVLLLGLLGPWLYGIWTSHKLEIGRTMFIVLAAGTLTSGLWTTSSVVLTAANRHERFALLNFLMAAGSVPLCYYLCLFYGLAAGACATLIIDLALIPYVFKAAAGLTGDDWHGFVAGVLRSVGDVYTMLRTKFAAVVR